MAHLSFIAFDVGVQVMLLPSRSAISNIALCGLKRIGSKGLYGCSSMKEDRSEQKKDSRGLIRSRLKSVNIDTEEEEIENILTECFDSESCCIKWWNYY